MKLQSVWKCFRLTSLLFMVSFAIVACGGKKSKVGGDRRARNQPQSPSQQNPSPQGHSQVPGGVSTGPTLDGEKSQDSDGRIGVSPRDSDDSNDTRDQDKDSETSSRGNIPKSPPSRDSGGSLPHAPDTERPGLDPSENRSGSHRPPPKPKRSSSHDIPYSPVLNQPWYPPNFENSPAESWLVHNIDPFLKPYQTGGPRPQPQGPLLLTLALGYFDGSQTNPLYYDEVNYGIHAPVDSFLRAAAHEVFTRRCRGYLQLCGFEVVKVNAYEAVYRKTGVDHASIYIRMLSGAVAETHHINTGIKAAEQEARSDAAEAAFLRSFKDSDLVVYVGHSRDGGGPDFHVPRLNGSGNVDYSYYRSERPGLKTLVGSLNTGGNRARAIAILSCDSNKFFYSEIKRAIPQAKLWTVQGQVYSENLMAQAMEAFEVFLRTGTLTSN